MSRDALSFEDVWKSYPQVDGRELHAVRSVTARVESGLRVAIVGRSGSGKSTFLHLAAGIDEPSRGEVSVLGRRLSELGDYERTLQRREKIGPGPINNMALYVEAGVDSKGFVDGLKARYADLPLLIRSDRVLREQVFEVFDQTFAITRLLQAISLLIAVCGITLTLTVLARERISELALYRALGARRRQIFRVFLGKGLGMALFGLVMGAGGGLALALILILIINRVYFGWTIAFHWPWGALTEQALTILTASVLASLYPALRASRTPATELSLENL